MSKEKELIKNTLIILLGKTCTQFISLFLLPLYTRILSSSEYGTVDLIVTYVALIAPIVSVQLEMAMFRSLIDSRNDKKRINKIITNAYSIVFIQTIIFVLIYVIFVLAIDIPYKFYILPYIVITIFCNILLQTARGLGHNINYSIGSSIAGILTLVFNVIFLVFLKFGVEGMLLSTILANTIAFIYLLIGESVYKKIEISLNTWSEKKKYYKYSLPLVPNGLIWWIINVSDRTIISIVLGVSQNGIYAVANKFSNILIQVYNVFNLSWTESASLHINDVDRDEFFSNVFNKVLKEFLCVCLCINSLISIAFNILIDSSFHEAYNYIPLLLIGMVFNIIVSFIGSIYIAKKKTGKVATTSFYSGILNIVINIILIKHIKLYAAVLSTVLSFAIMAIYRYCDVQKDVKLRFKKKENLILIIAFIINSILYYYNNIALNVANIMFSIMFSIILNKNEMEQIRIKLLSKIRKQDKK